MSQSLIVFKIAKMTNVSVSSAANWHKRFLDFPAPLAELNPIRCSRKVRWTKPCEADSEIDLPYSPDLMAKVSPRQPSPRRGPRRARLAPLVWKRQKRNSWHRNVLTKRCGPQQRKPAAGVGRSTTGDLSFEVQFQLTDPHQEAPLGTGSLLTRPRPCRRQKPCRTKG
jgi:hypothetical protein